jgi:hypothetical protein
MDFKPNLHILRQYSNIRNVMNVIFTHRLHNLETRHIFFLNLGLVWRLMFNAENDSLLRCYSI